MKIKHYFFAIPSKYSCISGDWKTPTFSSNFNVFAVESKYPYIDVIETFKKVACSKKLFFNEDIHCNDFGNKLMAQELLKEME